MTELAALATARSTPDPSRLLVARGESVPVEVFEPAHWLAPLEITADARMCWRSPAWREAFDWETLAELE